MMANGLRQTVIAMKSSLLLVHSLSLVATIVSDCCRRLRLPLMKRIVELTEEQKQLNRKAHKDIVFTHRMGVTAWPPSGLRSKTKRKLEEA